NPSYLTMFFTLSLHDALPIFRSLPGFDVTTGFRPTVAFTCLVNRDHVEVTFDSPKVRIAEVVFVDHKETSGSFEDSTRTSLRLWRALGRCRVHTAGPARFS